MSELNITIQINSDKKELFIAEESSSGATYGFNNMNELVGKIQFYLENYYKENIENSDVITNWTL